LYTQLTIYGWDKSYAETLVMEVQHMILKFS